jgi:hypothetical protein
MARRRSAKQNTGDFAWHAATAEQRELTFRGGRGKLSIALCRATAGLRLASPWTTIAADMAADGINFRLSNIRRPAQKRSRHLREENHA